MSEWAVLCRRLLQQTSSLVSRAPEPGRTLPVEISHRSGARNQTCANEVYWVPYRITRLLNFRVVLLQRFTQSSQRFIDRPLPLRDFMPFAGHLAIAGLDLWIGHSRGSNLALIRLLPTDIAPASHQCFSRSALT